MSNFDREWGSLVESHLLAGVDVFEVNRGWMWDYFDNFTAHESHPKPDNIVYSSRENCIKAVTHLMRNSKKLEYAKNIASESVKYARNF